MAKVTSNADEVADWLDELTATFGFDRPGVEGSLGRDCAGAAAQAMIDRAVADGKDANDSPLKPNSNPYAAWKMRRYDAGQPLIRTGQLLSLVSMLGETTIGPDKVTMKYGTGEPPSGSLNGFMAPGDRTVTDRQKAAFVTGDRPFYRLDGAIGAEIVALIDAALAEHLKS